MDVAEPDEPVDPDEPIDPDEPVNPDEPTEVPDSLKRPIIKVDIQLVEREYTITIPSDFVSGDVMEEVVIPAVMEVVYYC